MRISILLGFLSIVLPAAVLSAQNPGDERVREAAAAYISEVEDNAAIYMGVSVPRLVHGTVQSMYLRPKGYAERDEWGRELLPAPFINLLDSYTEGDLVFDGILYPGIKMRLDLYRDKIVALTPDASNDVELDPGRVEYAVIQNYRIVHIAADKLNGMPEGYYQELLSGKYPVFKKETYLYNDISKNFVERKRKYYIVKDGKPYNVKNKGGILKLFRDQRQELNQYISDNHIRFKEDWEFENAVVQIVSEYERNE